MAVYVVYGIEVEWGDVLNEIETLEWLRMLSRGGDTILYPKEGTGRERYESSLLRVSGVSLSLVIPYVLVS